MQFTTLLASTALLLSSTTTALPFLLEARQQSGTSVLTPGWSFCPSNGGYAGIFNLLISPYQPPQPISVQWNGASTSDIEVTSGSVNFTYALLNPNGSGNILLKNTKLYDLCTLPGMNCPIDAVNAQLNFQLPPPTVAKSSSGLNATVTITVYDQVKNIYLCVTNPTYSV
ncbi:hypothetical protein HDU98_011143 [Podochytrium sp. JEL0797]|nr:hypothetical protein HDU98_011143 [Podochytrium sp. JEL0797]